jgi:hypothetical protein
MDAAQYQDWLQNVPEAAARAQSGLSAITPTPPTPTGLNVSNTNAADVPQLAFDGQGTLHLIWMDLSLQSTGSVFYRQLAGGQWSEPENISEDFEFIFGNLALRRRPDGVVCAFWEGAVASGGQAGYFQRCRAEPGWAEAALVTPIGRGFAPAFAADGTLAVLTWRPNNIYFGETQLSDDALSASPLLAIDSAGGYHAAWHRLGDPFSLEYRFSGDGGQTWDEAQALTDADDAPDGLSFDIAADALGGVHLAWAGYQDLYYRRWTSAGGWEAPVALTGDAPTGNLNLEVGADGLAHVLWQSVSEGVWYAIQSPDGTWAAPRQLAPDYGNWGANGPAMVLDAQGAAHIVWKNDALGRDLYYFNVP